MELRRIKVDNIDTLALHQKMYRRRLYKLAERGNPKGDESQDQSGERKTSAPERQKQKQ